MTELERYISSNPEAFDSEPVPSGSRTRFMVRIALERSKRRTKVISMAFAGIAAACAVLMVFTSVPDLSRDLKLHHQRLAEKEIEIMAMAEMEYPDETDIIMNTVRSITAEAIPLEDQLPDEMSLREKSRILDEYYGRKVSALEELIEQYTESL